MRRIRSRGSSKRTNEESELLTERFERRWCMRPICHREQRRKGSGVPYVAHLLAVCALTLEYGGTKTSRSRRCCTMRLKIRAERWRARGILRQFGERVTEIVEGCTDTDESPKPPGGLGKKTYIRHVRERRPRCGWFRRVTKLAKRAIAGMVSSVRRALWDRFRELETARFGYYRAMGECVARAERRGGGWNWIAWLRSWSGFIFVTWAR